MTDTNTLPGAEDFFDTWNIYRKIVANNNMFHKEIYADVQQVLTALGNDFSVLDLGCGDAACLAPVLAGQAVSHYHGVDLSQTALGLAAANLAALSCPVSFQQADLLQALLDTEQRYQVIFSSFALHHLPLAQKGEFFQAVYPRLAEGGLLLLIDTCRDADESLSTYLASYCDWLCNDWVGINDEEKTIACRHITENDLPEELATLTALARSAGFTQCLEVSQYRWHRVLSFQ